MGLKVGVENVARNATNAYVGVIEMTNLCPKINGATNFTIRSNSGTATGESSTVHTKYSQQSLKLNITDTNTAEVYASSSTSLPLNPEHIYYARIEAYQETKFGAVELYFPIAEPPMFNLATGDVGKWNMYSVVKERSSFTAGNYTFRLDFNRERSTETAGSIWYDGWMIIDLTEAFGSGNEPTKEWCDANIPYFEGTTVVRNYNAVGIARKIKQICIGDENSIARLVYPTGEEQNGRFVCVGDSGKSYYSTDGTSWTAMTGLISGSYYTFHGVCYGKDRFVCVGTDGRAYYSTDGTTWTEMSGLPNYEFFSVTYGNGRFVCVGESGFSHYSIDGETWTKMTGLGDFYDYNAVTYGNGRFVCVGTKGESYYSTNGTSWTDMSGLSAGYTYFGVTYGNGRFICVGESGKSYYSTNGTTWTEMSGASGNLRAVTYGNDRFVAVGERWGSSYYSTDGTTWVAMTGMVDSTSCGHYGVCYGNDRFVAVGKKGYSYYSTNGVNWVEMTGLASATYYAVCYGEKQELKPFEFTSNIIPAFTSATQLDQYGTWKVTHSSDNGDDVEGWYAFDMDSHTYWQSAGLRSSSSTAWVQIDCPIKILPSTIYLSQRMIASGKIQGYNDSTGEWEDLADITSSSNWRSDTYTITTQKYYSSFRVYGVRYSSTYNTTEVRDFEIRTGKAKP